MMTRAAWIGVVIGVAVLIGAYWLLSRDDSADVPLESVVAESLPPSDEVPAPEVAAQDAAIVNPIPEPEVGGTALPELEDSDAEAMSELRNLFGAETVDSFIVPRELIRRVVLTVDSLDREPLPLWLRPIRRVPGNFEVEGGADATRIDADNARRYAVLMTVIEKTDIPAFAAVYRRYYPLFQDAYDRLGNPRSRYFNDRFIAVIDHLLETPVVEEPIALVRPKGVYLYADPELEALSSGQKLLLRMGRDNAAQVQAKLRQLRSAIAARPAS